MWTYLTQLHSQSMLVGHVLFGLLEASFLQSCVSSNQEILCVLLQHISLKLLMRPVTYVVNDPHTCMIHLQRCSDCRLCLRCFFCGYVLIVGFSAHMLYVVVVFFHAVVTLFHRNTRKRHDLSNTLLGDGDTMKIMSVESQIVALLWGTCKFSGLGGHMTLLVMMGTQFSLLYWGSMKTFHRFISRGRR